MILPQRYYDNTQNEKDFTRAQRAMLNQFKNTDATGMMQNAMAYQANLDRQREDINQKIKERNLSENIRVNAELNKEKNRKLLYDNEQRRLDNNIASAKAMTDMKNMINFSNLAYDAVIKGGQTDRDLINNRKNAELYAKALKQDKMELFEKENLELINKYKISKNKLDTLQQEAETLKSLYNQNLGTSEADEIQKQLNVKLQELEKQKKETIDIEKEYKEKYKQYLGSNVEQLDEQMRNEINFLKINPLYTESGAYRNKKPYLSTPFYVRKKGGLLKKGGLTLDEKKEFHLYKKQLESQLKKMQNEEKNKAKLIERYIISKERADRVNNARLWQIVKNILKK